MLGVSADTYLHRVRLGIFADGNAQKMAKLVSRGSAGCIAALDQLNPRVSIKTESEPWLGAQLKVEWLRFISTETNLQLNIIVPSVTNGC